MTPAPPVALRRVGPSALVWAVLALRFGLVVRALSATSDGRAHLALGPTCPLAAGAPAPAAT